MIANERCDQVLTQSVRAPSVTAPLQVGRRPPRMLVLIPLPLPRPRTRPPAAASPAGPSRRSCGGRAAGTRGQQGRSPARLSTQTRGRQAVGPPCLTACLCIEGEACSWYFYSNKKTATAFPPQLHGDMRREAGRSRQPRPAPRGCAGGTVTGGASPLLPPSPSQPRTLRRGDAQARVHEEGPGSPLEWLRS